jgi:YebC/PmpR family DNA-binding regulatory protein
MAGHSQFKNIMHRKGAQDKRRAKIFTKIAREITVAVKLGSQDPSSNPRLRGAIAEAREVNMPKDNIERAIKKALGPEGGDSNFEEIRYEGYAIDGVAVIVEALTDNRNRTASEVRSLFTKRGGALGENGSVAFLFDRVGLVSFKKEGLTYDGILEQAIEAGAEDVKEDDEYYTVVTTTDNLHAVADFLVSALKKDYSSANLTWEPKMLIEVKNPDSAKSILGLIDALEDLDDVQKVYANFDIDESILSSI